jgi:hypothetical protein
MAALGFLFPGFNALGLPSAAGRSQASGELAERSGSSRRVPVFVWISPTLDIPPLDFVNLPIGLAPA